MTRSYGNMPRRRKQQPIAPPAELTVVIPGNHTLEELARALQQMVARLRQLRVHGAETFRARLEALDAAGAPLPLPVDGEPEPQSVGTHIAIAGRHTLDQLVLEVQKAVAHLDEQGVHAVRQFRSKCQPLDSQAAAIALWSAAGAVIATINIPDLPVEKP